MINPYFSRKEFNCKCGTCKDNDVVDVEILEVLMRLRDYFGQPITITSGNRCLTHNKKVGGSPFSKHLVSKAVDMKIKNTHPSEVYKVLDLWYQDKYGIGQYSEFTHFDIRNKRARW